MCAQSLSCVQLFATPRIVAHQAPLPVVILQAKILQQVAISLLQGIFPTQGLNPYFLHWQVDSLPLSHLGSSAMVWYTINTQIGLVWLNIFPHSCMSDLVVSLHKGTTSLCSKQKVPQISLHNIQIPELPHRIQAPGSTSDNTAH